MSKRYTSTISITWEGNMLDAENIKEYIKQLKQGFLEEFGIPLNDTDINNIKDYGDGAVVREIDFNKFTFVTKDFKKFWFDTKWLGRPEEVWIN